MPSTLPDDCSRAMGAKGSKNPLELEIQPFATPGKYVKDT